MIDPVDYVNSKRLSNIKKNLKKKDIKELFEVFEAELHAIRHDYGIEAKKLQQLLDIIRIIKIKCIKTR